MSAVCRSIGERGPAALVGPSQKSSPSSSAAVAALAARMGLPRADMDWAETTSEEEMETSMSELAEDDLSMSTISLFPEPSIVGSVRGKISEASKEQFVS